VKKQQSLLLGGVVAGLLGGGLYAGPYVALYQLRQAVEHRDLQGVASRVDFPALRTSVKTNLQAIAQTEVPQQNPLMSLIGTFLRGILVDPVLDRVVSAEGVAALLEGQRLQFGEGQSAQFSRKAASVKVRARYESLNRFAVDVKPEGDSTSVTLLLSREGLAWKLSGVRLPGV
jgi:Protein of unknown function (DUF2939)